MNYGNIKDHDIANGPGVRVSLFVSGCTHHCYNCFNPETWDFGYGEEFTEDTERQIMDYMDHGFIAGLSLLGGEPFEPQNSRVLAPFVKQVRERFPDKTIWSYSGYTYEEISSGKLGESGRDLLAGIDVLVDGEFVEEKKNISLRFRGSENQRIIDAARSLEAGNVVLWKDPLEVLGHHNPAVSL